MAQTESHPEASAVQNLIRECHEVAHWASSCAVRCIEHAEEGMQDCALMCLDAENVAEVLAALASRGSEHTTVMAGAVQEVLSACADMCSKMSGQAGDGHNTMENCAKACRAAAESCAAYMKTGR